MLAVLATALVLMLGCAARPVVPARPVDGDHIAGTRRRTHALRPSWRWRVGHRSKAIDPAEVAAWCDALARSVRGRSSLAEAVRANRATPELERHMASVRLAIDRGTPLADALAAAISDDPNLNMAVIVLRTCALHGGPAAEPIDRVGAALRQRAALAAERRGHSAQARLSAHVMTALPSLLLAVLIASSASVRATVWSPVGTFVIACGVALNSLGWWWMRRLIDRAGR